MGKSEAARARAERDETREANDSAGDVARVAKVLGCSGATMRKRSVTVLDPSERTRPEDALRMSEERLRVALQASPAVVFSQDAQLRYTWIHNPKDPFIAARVLDKTDFDLLPRADAEELTTLKRRVLETGIGGREVVRTTIGGEVFYYDLTVEPVRDGSGRTVGITCATWDVTGQKRMEQQERFLAELGTALMAAGDDADETLVQFGRLAVREFADWFIISLVEDGTVRRLQVGHSDPEKSAIAKALERVVLDRHQRHLIYEPLENGRALVVPEVTPEFVESISQGDEHLALLRQLDAKSLMTAPLVVRGRVAGAFAAISSREPGKFQERDAPFAERIAHLAALALDNAQAHASARRAVAARDEVLRIVAHDLRNPLGAAQFAAMTLLRMAPEADRRLSTRRLAERIERSLGSANRLIKDLLDVGRIETGRLSIDPGPVDSNELLARAADAMEAMASLASLELVVEAPERLPAVHADKERALQVFSNLIGNAIKFTPAGGTVRIGGAQRGKEVHFWTADNGPGIAPGDIPKVFDRFWQARTTDHRGAGLGLTIAKGIVESHGGRLWVESTPGAGSTFYFSMAVAPCECEASDGELQRRSG